MIVVFGSINLDLIFALDRLPAAGETVLGPGVAMQPGGKGANQAVAAARDGAVVAMVGAVGHDALAETALAGLRRAGVDLGRVATRPVATGCAAICTDPAGRNLIAVGSGANRDARQDQVEAALLGPTTTLVLQMEVASSETAALIYRARAAGSRIVLNLAPAVPLDGDALRSVDFLIVNEPEAAWLATELNGSPDRLHATLGVTVVRTLGARGVAYAGADWAGTVAGLPVTPVDTTAAGDCFAGVFAAALDRLISVPDAVTRANTAAALCCTRAGSQDSLPHRDEIDAALANETLPRR